MLTFFTALLFLFSLDFALSALGNDYCRNETNI